MKGNYLLCLSIEVLLLVGTVVFITEIQCLLLAIQLSGLSRWLVWIVALRTWLKLLERALSFAEVMPKFLV